MQQADSIKGDVSMGAVKYKDRSKQTVFARKCGTGTTPQCSATSTHNTQEEYKNGRQRKAEERKNVNTGAAPLFPQYFAWVHFEIIEPYVHVIAQHGAGSILQPALMCRAVQNPGEHRVRLQLPFDRRVVQAPAPAATSRGRPTQNENALEMPLCYKQSFFHMMSK